MNIMKWSITGAIAASLMIATPAVLRADNDDIKPEDAKKMVHALDQHKITLSAAIKTAEESCKGKALTVACEMEKGSMNIAVFCMAGDKLMDIDINPKTGKITESKEVKDEKLDDKKPGDKKDEKKADAKADEEEGELTPADAKKILAALGDSKFTLAAAVEAAEASCKGKAVKAEFEIEKDKLVVGVDCLAGEKLLDIDIDAKTGKVAESKEAGADEKEDAKSKKKGGDKKP